MENEDTDLSPGLQKFLNAIAYFIAFFFWLNLYGFLNLFFGILVPNHPKNDFLHYTILAIILIIAACVTETLRRRRKSSAFSFIYSLSIYRQRRCDLAKLVFPLTRH
jgi:uncharacterized membrane protein HdeD (DUF308 family)